MKMDDENKEENSDEITIEEEVLEAVERKTEKIEEEQKRMGFRGRTGREMAEAMYYGTTIPILIGVGILVGWYLTKDQSATVHALGVLGGATLGLLWGVFDIIRKEKKSLL